MLTYNIVFLSIVISSLAKSSAAFGFAVSPHAIYPIIIINNNMISIMMMMMIMFT